MIKPEIDLAEVISQQNVESAHWLLPADSDKTGKGRDELKKLWSRI